MKFNNFLLGLAVPSIFGFLIYCIIAIRFDFFGLGILSTLLASILILSILLNFGISPKVTRVCANSDGDYITISKEITNSFFITFFLTLSSYLIVKSFSFSFLQYLFITDEIILKICLVSFLTALNKSVTSTYIGLNNDKNFLIGVVLRSSVVLFYLLFSDIYRIDILMIAYFKGAVVVGIYSIISMGLEVLRELARTTFVSRSSYIVEKNDYFSENEKSSTISTLLKVATLLFILGLAGSSIGIDLLKALTNLEIQNDTKLYLFIFSTITALLSSNTFLKEVLPHLNLPGVNSIISIISLVINVALNFYLIPRFDILGALLSSTFSVLIALILRIILLRKNLN